MSVQRFCRTCLATDSTMIPLFHGTGTDFDGDSNKFVVDLLELFTESAIVAFDEKFSHHICADCLDEMQRTYAFIIKCKQSDIAFRQLAESEVILTPLNDITNHLDAYENFQIAHVKTIEIDDSENESLFVKEEMVEEDFNERSEVEILSDQTPYDFVIYDITEDDERDLDEAHSERTESEGEEMSHEIIQCPACLDIFHVIAVFRAHLIEVHTMNNMCIMCDNEYFENIWNHSKCHLPKNIQCAKCDKRFVRESNFHKHMKTHAQQTLYVCEFCHIEFNSKELIRLHVSEKHPFECDVCFKRFNSEVIVERHKLVHSTELGPYKCSTCNKEFIQKCYYDNHISYHCGDRIFYCKYCPFKDKVEKNLTNHEKGHVAQVLYACSLCSFKFTDRSKFDRHKAQHHTEPYKFQCEICFKEFRDKNYLNEHKTIHSVEKRYKCNRCDGKFRFKENLEKHLLTHSNERPYSCTLCPVKYRQRKVLLNHLRRKHAGAERIPCGLCETIVTSTAQLSSHWKYMHSH